MLNVPSTAHYVSIIDEDEEHRVFLRRLPSSREVHSKIFRSVNDCDIAVVPSSLDLREGYLYL